MKLAGWTGASRYLVFRCLRVETAEYAEMRESAANVDGAEAENHMPASGGTAEAQHWPEARENQDLIE